MSTSLAPTRTAELTLDTLLQSAFDKSPYFNRRRPTVEASDGRIVLRGRVGSWYQKQMAQEVVRSLQSLAQIENELEVGQP